MSYRDINLSLSELMQGNEVIARAAALTPVYHQWTSLVGDRVAAATKPLAVTGTTLWIGVKNSVWAQQLSLMKEHILDKLRKETTLEISDVRCRVVRITGNVDKSHTRPRPTRPPVRGYRQRPDATESRQQSMSSLEAAWAAHADCNRRCRLCGAALGPSEESVCPPCTIKRNNEELERAVRLVASDPAASTSPSFAHRHGISEHALAAARAILEAHQRTSLNDLVRNARSGQEMTARLKKTMDTLSKLLLGKSLAQLSAEEATVVFGVELAQYSQTGKE